MRTRVPAFEPLEIPADERRLGEVRDFVDRVCAELGFTGRTAASIRLAVDEACSNVVEHAYAGEPGTVSIAAAAQRGWLEIRVVDRGTPFDGRASAPQLANLIESRRRGGLGLFLMHRLMDEVKYETTPAGNEWILRKRLPQAPATFSRRLRVRHAARAAAALVVVTAIAITPLWIHEGQERERANLETLRARAFVLAEAARPVLVHRAELSPAQTSLFEAVHAFVREDPRVLSVTVVDREGTIWASDRSTATFTRYAEPAGLGRPDADGMRRVHAVVEGHPLVHLAFPVRVGDAGALVGAVHLAVRQDDLQLAIRAARVRLLGAGLALDLAALALIFAAVSALLRPLQRLVDGLRGLAPGESQLAEDGPEEIGAIAAAFNDIQARYRAVQESAAEHERLQHDLQLASEIQTAILPQFVPEIPGFEIARLYRPAAQVGGDYYDFLDAGDGLTGVVVADVAGKGVSGSLVMGMLRTALRMETRRNAHAGDVLARLHEFLSADLHKGMFVTMLYVVLDTRHRVISYASAGHTPMVLYRADADETFCLSPAGIPVGLPGSDAASFERSLDVERLRLRAGDLLLLYTDGVTEALDAEGRAYGEERLLAAVKRWGRESAETFVARLQEDLAAFTGAALPSDDVTLVAIKEKAALPQAQGETLAKLAHAIEVEGATVAEACRRHRVSPSTYYRFKHAGAEPSEPDTLSVEKGAALRRLAEAHPELETGELVRLLRSPEWGGFDLPPTRVHAELRRQGLLRPVAAAARVSTATVTAAGGVAVAEEFVEQGGLRAVLECAAETSGHVVLQLEGCVDSGSCDALERILETATAARSFILVDLHEVAYVSSRGWGVLATAAARVQHRGGLALARVRAQVRDVHRMLGFDAVVPAYADRDAALAAWAASAASRDTAAVAAVMAIPRPDVVVDFDAEGGDWESLRLRFGSTGGDVAVTVLALDGVLDTVTAQRFQRALTERGFTGGGAVLVDLSRLEFVSSAGWGCLAAFAAERRAQGGSVRLFGMGPAVARIHSLLHLETALPSDDVLADALAACGAREVAVPERVASGAIAKAPPAAAAEADPGAYLHAGLRAHVEPYGTSGRARRLVLEGAWAGTSGPTLGPWLARHAAPAELLLVDARGVDRADAAAWRVLQHHVGDLETRGVAVRVVAPAAPAAAPPAAFALPLHGSLVEALRAQQWRAGSLEISRLDPGDFERDAGVRREGWAAYLELLRQAYREESA